MLVFRKYLNTYCVKESGNKDYTKEVSGMKMLDSANEFVLYHFDRLAGPHKSIFVDGCFIDKPRREFICLTKFVFLFGRWAFLDRYTNSKIRLNNF